MLLCSLWVGSVGGVPCQQSWVIGSIALRLPAAYWVSVEASSGGRIGLRSQSSFLCGFGSECRMCDLRDD